MGGCPQDDGPVLTGTEWVGATVPGTPGTETNENTVVLCGPAVEGGTAGAVPVVQTCELRQRRCATGTENSYGRSPSATTGEEDNGDRRRP